MPPAGRGAGPAAVRRHPRWKPRGATSTPPAGAGPRTSLPSRARRLSPTAVAVAIGVVAAALVVLGLLAGLGGTTGSVFHPESTRAGDGQGPSAVGTTTVPVIPEPIVERQLNGHTGTVRSVATAQLDGRPVIISGGDDRTVRVWDLATGTPVGDPFTGHTDSVIAVATAQLDGRPVVVSGGADARCGCGTWPPAPRSATRSPATPTPVLAVAHRAARRAPGGHLRQRRPDGAGVGPGHRPPRSATRSPATPTR